MKPSFNPAIIDELRKRVTAHNEIVAAYPEMTMKLGAVKKLYKRWYSGEHPQTHALAMLDARLLTMQAEVLQKATGPFDAGRHPRGRGGRFRPIGRKGGGGAVTPPAGGGGGGGPGRPVVPMGEDGDDAYLQAAQIQVIPETRYSTLGPPIAGAAGMVHGIVGGATARAALPWRGGGSFLDRQLTNVMGAAGSGVGKLTGVVARNMAIDLPRELARDVIPIINRRYGTHIRRPSPNAGKAAGDAIVRATGYVGRKSARSVGHALNAFTLPAAVVGQLATRLHGPIAGRVAAGVVGGATAGIAGAATMYHLQSMLGPYEDALFPRRVKKLAGPLWDAPEVLAKQAELLAQPLAKGVIEEELAKASVGQLLNRLRFLRGPGARAYSAAFRRPVPPAPAPPPLGRPQQAAEEVFSAARPQFTVGRNRLGRAGYVAAHVAGLGTLGAGTGALTGVALASFAQQHPRDPKTGQFRTKGDAAVSGAIHGAIVGSGLGLAAGLVAARSGQGNLVRQAVQRLLGETPSGEVANLSSAMTARTESTARDSFAKAFFHDNIKRLNRGLPENQRLMLSPDGKVTVEQLRQHIGSRAVNAWLETEGTAMRAGAKQWYQQQLDEAFNAEVGERIGKLKGANAKLPKKNQHPNLIESVDEAALTPQQRKVWVAAVKRRAKTRTEIDNVFEERNTAVKGFQDTEGLLRAQKGQLDDKVKRLPGQWRGLLDNNAPIADLKAFASRVDLKLKGTKRDDIVKEIDDHMPNWIQGSEDLSNSLGQQIRQHADAHTQAVSSLADDLSATEALRVQNPWAKGKKASQLYFKGRLQGIDTAEGFDQIKEAIRVKATRKFDADLKADVDASLEHLKGLVTTHEAALRARIPQSNAFSQFVARQLPEFSAWMVRARRDIGMISTAHRGDLQGWSKDIYDFVHANSNVAAAWGTATKFAADAANYWQTGPGQWMLRNWGPISTVLGAASAVGAIDLQAKGDKNIVEFNPSKWTRPRDIQIVTEFPNPIRKPHEAVFGLSYRDPSGQRKFLHGMHIKSKDGQDYQNIPFGAEYNKVMNAVSGGGGGDQGNRPQQAKVDNPDQVNSVMARGKAQGDITDVGPAGFAFPQRRQGGGVGDNEERAVKRWFQNEYINGLVQNVPPGQSTHQHDKFYASLRDLFDSPQAGLFTRATRAELLLGNLSSRDQRSRGIFANKGFAFHGTDNTRKANELINQINARGAEPTTPEEYGHMHRALWIASTHMGLPNDLRANVMDKLNEVYRTHTGDEPPTAMPPRSRGNVRSGGNIETEIDNLVSQYSLSERQRRGMDQWPTDDAFRSEMRGLYQTGRQIHFTDHPSSTEAEQNDAGLGFMQAAIDKYLRKAGDSGDLYKLFGLTKLSPFDEQRHPRGGHGMFREDGRPNGSAVISGARAHMAHPASPGPPTGNDFGTYPPTQRDRRPPESPGMAPTEARPGSIGDMARPQHVLSQLGVYGLSQAGWDAIGNVASHFKPSGGMVWNATKFGMQAIGGIGGAIAGQEGGVALGRQLGDRGPPRPELPPGEGIARGLGGAAGQMLAAPLIRRAAIAGAARIVGGAAGSVIGPVGTILGSALAGALTDEGVGILYRHLSRYGAHVPEHAVKHFRSKEARA